MHVLPYAIGFLLPPLVVWSTALGGWWSWLPVLVLYAGLPLADALTALNPVHHARDESLALERDPRFRLVTVLWVPVHAVMLAWSLWIVSRGGLTAVEMAGLTAAVGTVAGAIGITYAHELIHRPGRFELALGDVLLTLVTYPHFAIEHVHGHHHTVATPEDPVTARRGEGYYRFLLRAVPGSLCHAWAIETALVRRHGAGAFSRRHRMLRYGVTTAAVYAGVAWWFGGGGVLFMAAQSAVAIALVEAINYVEHYGLLRAEIAAGRYERVSARHSWDSSHRVSNWLLINLARHADHHLLASKRYQALDTTALAPQLPAGYGAMVLLAFVPVLWRRVMDPRLPPLPGGLD